MKLEGKVAIVTGAASGIGKATAILFAQEGARVVVSDLNLEGAQLTVADIKAKGGQAKPVLTDIAKEEDIRVLFDTTLQTYSTLDILVNNAGIMDNFAPAANVTDELWEKVFAVNSTGPMRTIRRALPIFLTKNAGIIINISSIGGLQGCRAGAAYAASKHAIIGLTKNVGFMYATKGIRCNAIAPGGVTTNIGSTIKSPDQFGMSRAMAGINLNPRTGAPEEIARIALFLASDDSSFINGAVIAADAGWTAY